MIIGAVDLNPNPKSKKKRGFGDSTTKFLRSGRERERRLVIKTPSDN